MTEAIAGPNDDLQFRLSLNSISSKFSSSNTSECCFRMPPPNAAVLDHLKSYKLWLSSENSQSMLARVLPVYFPAQYMLSFDFMLKNDDFKFYF